MEMRWQLMDKLQNPILRGFHPDASVVKVNQDYYLATSTFEWWPGVEIYHSRDLVNWELVAQPLNRSEQLNLVGNYNSGSIWAPHISYSEGKFWLLITDVKTGTAFKDTLNYVMMSETIEGPWSDPIFVTATGFDPAFFHDEDGKHYIMSMLFDHRLEKPNFNGLVIQEFDCQTLKLMGKREHFFYGTDLGVCEGPQIMKRDGWYYLLCAAGGTGYNHASTVCRSKQILGPYEVSPYHPLITTIDDLENPLQKSGHASFVEVSPDEWYITHICARPLTQRGNCPLGRETSLQKIEWIDGWPRLANGTVYPELTIEKPSIGAGVQQCDDYSERVDFGAGILPKSFKSLRRPLAEKMSFTDHPGFLRLYGEQSIASLHRQTLLARRWQSFTFRAETAMYFEPKSFQQLAGVTLFYDTDNWYYLQVSYDEEEAVKTIQLQSASLNKYQYHSERIEIPKNELISLAVEVDREQAQFFYKMTEDWIKIGEPVRADYLSDDYIDTHGKLAFTGAFVGICTQDLDDHSSFADYKYFDYIEQQAD